MYCLFDFFWDFLVYSGNGDETTGFIACSGSSLMLLPFAPLMQANNRKS
jgi:hypothetical protein